MDVQWEARVRWLLVSAILRLLGSRLFKLFRERWRRVGLAIEAKKLALLEGLKVARGLGVSKLLMEKDL